MSEACPRCQLNLDTVPSKARMVGQALQEQEHCQLNSKYMGTVRLFVNLNSIEKCREKDRNYPNPILCPENLLSGSQDFLRGP